MRNVEVLLEVVVLPEEDRGADPAAVDLGVWEKPANDKKNNEI